MLHRRVLDFALSVSVWGEMWGFHQSLFSMMRVSDRNNFRKGEFILAQSGHSPSFMAEKGQKLGLDGWRHRELAFGFLRSPWSSKWRGEC